MFEKNFLGNSPKGKLAQTSKKFRQDFLLLFVKELIKNSIPEIHKLDYTIKKKGKELIKRREEEKKRRKIFEKDPFKLSLMHQFPQPDFEKELLGSAPKIFATAKKHPPIIPKRKPIIHPKIQHPPLPPNLQYLHPYPTKTQVNLGKLEPLGNDSNVKVIECNGPDEPIIVKGNMGTKPSNITLSHDEIDEVLGAFSKASKIPLNEGIFKIVAGKYILSAIISSVVGSKFIIHKMNNPALKREVSM